MRVLSRGALLLAICVAALPAKSDEIQLKDGKTFYGVIVAYDNNMFKVKTDFGYILVEKSKISAILPNGSEAAKSDVKSPAPKTAPEAAGSNARKQAERDRSLVTAEPVKTEAVSPSPQPAVLSTAERIGPRVSSAPVRPALPPNATKTTAIAPSIKTVPSAAAAALATTATPLTPSKQAAIPEIPEEVQGNIYTNHVYGFRMYKAPSWQLIDDATELPNAIVAMGTPNASTLLVVGREKTRQPLDAAAIVVEKRLHEVYDDYKQTSQRKTVVGGLPAVEYRYRGKAESHDWSGTLVVVSRGSDILTALGMTYADTDLIQIQENVIARAIASLDFNIR
jgi:hypothetical protein